MLSLLHGKRHRQSVKPRLSGLPRKLLSVTLLLGLTLVTACAHQQTKPPLPPVLKMYPIEDSVCMSFEDAVQLGAYLMELEGK